MYLYMIEESMNIHSEWWNASSEYILIDSSHIAMILRSSFAECPLDINIYDIN